MTPSLQALLTSVLLGIFVVVIPITAALIFVSNKDKVVRN
uniref:Photosystem II reaction center protein X n=2 Tax=Pavlovaceae TaxID=418969 RepID=M1K5D0_DIALT|nr:photosystem II protein X [Diacronema lutheri]YP_009863832.1 photosystem II protein X [Pavlova sp. NIVA-4/92]AGE93809.1 photosystem II protein X [Diacronema lutheri]QKE31163.1 photosystem II protein X [Pavlova sp. NIVA-4/92]